MSNFFLKNNFKKSNNISESSIDLSKMLSSNNKLNGGNNNLNESNNNLNGSITSSSNLSKINSADINNLLSMLTSENENTNNNLDNKLKNMLNQNGGNSQLSEMTESTEQIEKRLINMLGKSNNSNNISENTNTEVLENKINNIIKSVNSDVNSETFNYNQKNLNHKGGSLNDNNQTNWNYKNWNKNGDDQKNLNVNNQTNWNHKNLNHKKWNKNIDDQKVDNQKVNNKNVDDQNGGAKALLTFASLGAAATLLNKYSKNTDSSEYNAEKIIGPDLNLNNVKQETLLNNNNLSLTSTEINDNKNFHNLSDTSTLNSDIFQKPQNQQSNSFIPLTTTTINESSVNPIFTKNENKFVNSDNNIKEQLAQLQKQQNKLEQQLQSQRQAQQPTQIYVQTGQPIQPIQPIQQSRPIQPIQPYHQFSEQSSMISPYQLSNSETSSMHEKNNTDVSISTTSTDFQSNTKVNSDNRLNQLGGAGANAGMRAFHELCSYVAKELNIPNGRTVKKIAGQLNKDIKEDNVGIKPEKILTIAKKYFKDNIEKYKELL